MLTVFKPLQDAGRPAAPFSRAPELIPFVRLVLTEGLAGLRFILKHRGKRRPCPLLARCDPKLGVQIVETPFQPVLRATRGISVALACGASISVAPAIELLVLLAIGPA